ncbi:anaphase-promoting protein [Leptospira perolatii]|uniref:Anaphase-promoting protein n=1 Tax=Leptospira perolatii TaxID=2023191 RepID=A0A2M9ZI00_9LEPT|nr:tetratricopeptide repeat protein [Leptospira perolatii]PJZ68033.1 anaphase-promoting protein [Leptospira perolatii]PJZ71687.1 anaphase-promoting protein [Leptospira perolatii]
MDPKLETALNFLKRGDFETAKSVLKSWVESSPNNSLAKFHYGMCLSQIGDLIEAEVQLHECVVLNESMVQAWIGLGVLYARKKDKAKAEFHFSKALELDETDVNAKRNLASIYTGSQKYDKALNLYSTLPESALADPMTLYALGICYLYTENLQKAGEIFKKLEAIGIPESIKKEFSGLKDLLEEKRIESKGIWTFLEDSGFD